MGLGMIQSNAPPVDPIRPTPRVFREGAFTLGKPESFRSGEQQSAPGKNTDATGLSLSQDEIAEALQQFERQQAETAPERAYQEAGRKARMAQELASSINTHGPASSASDPAQIFASAMSSGASANAEAAARNIAPSTSEKPTPEAASTKRDNDESDSAVSGGEEARSPERTFMGALAAVAGQPSGENTQEARRSKKDGKDEPGEEEEKDEKSGSGEEDLSEEEQQEVQELQDRDREVRTHEQAHISAGGSLVAGGPSYEMTTGPDGKSYATGGEVQIDTSKGSTPEETISRAQRIRSAALAPAQPSAQDQKVAAKASQMETEARQEKAQQSSGDESDGSGKEDGGKGASTGAVNENAQQQKAEQSGEPGASSAQERLALHAADSYRKTSGVSVPAPYGSAFSFAV